MKYKISLTPAKVCLFGAFNGLLVGTLFDAVRVAYENYELNLEYQENIRNYGLSGYIIRPMGSALIPLIGIIAFAGISHMTFIYFRRRNRLLLKLWILGGILILLERILTETLKYNALTLVYLTLFVGIAIMIYRLWNAHPQSVLLFWLVVSTSVVITSATVTQLLRPFVEQSYTLERMFVWFFSLVIVLGVNILTGLLIQAATYYPQENL